MINQYFNVYALRRVRYVGYATAVVPISIWIEIVFLFVTQIVQVAQPMLFRCARQLGQSRVQ